ncbi:MAG: hypothetical protein COV74_00265 [Candidatus Omnitrophica bacterium CG11_big_fil_rev_8_21_14_0_20_45_26]|uniref:Uncharacterized protein n=1 Tax=Candidatus Abzuiibacterium crystallinum TaxID=1974748 RepID=A0A2H0LSY8_9BACT|nr:MAG: hypothetical protein COV74_00265 [Candidatus Omnitrophica bacterium CG11_big_fil_rev_8_21_14_0_20_45_26]
MKPSKTRGAHMDEEKGGGQYMRTGDVADFLKSTRNTLTRALGELDLVFEYTLRSNDYKSETVERIEKTRGELRELISIVENEVAYLQLQSAHVGRNFIEWYLDRMTVMLLWIQKPIQKSQEAIQRQLFFMEELERCFVPPHLKTGLVKSFQWIRDYLKKYPKSSRGDHDVAVQQWKKIHDSLNDVFGKVPQQKIHLSSKEPPTGGS